MSCYQQRSDGFCLVSLEIHDFRKWKFRFCIGRWAVFEVLMVMVVLRGGLCVVMGG